MTTFWPMRQRSPIREPVSTWQKCQIGRAGADRNVGVDVRRFVNKGCGGAIHGNEFRRRVVRRAARSRAKGIVDVVACCTKRMGIAQRHFRFGAIDSMNEFDGRAGVADARAPAGENFLVDARVQSLEAVGEFDFLTVVGHRAIGVAALARGRARAGRRRRSRETNGLWPARASARRPFSAAREMDLARFDAAEQPQQQIEEMDADVQRDAARFLRRSFPGHVVPATAASDVGQADVGPFDGRSARRARA